MTINKYYDIYLQLKQKIIEGFYKESELLPSENALAEEYNVSRETIRKALDYLSQDGLIQKQQGKGSIILNSNLFNFPVSGLTSFKELTNSQQMETETLLISNRFLQIDEPLHKKTRWSLGKKVVAIERVRKMDGQKVIFDLDYLDFESTGEIPDNRLTESLYDYLEKDLQLPIAFAHKEIVVENVTAKDRSYMDLRDEDNHLVVIRSFVYLEDAQYFQFSESRHRVDRFRFVDFSRRQHTLDVRDF